MSGASEGFLVKAAIEHLNQRSWYVVYRDNSLSLAIAQKGVGKLKPLSGRLLWLQQRQGRETMTALLTDAALSRATIEVEAGQRNPEEQPSSLATAARPRAQEHWGRSFALWRL